MQHKGQLELRCILLTKLFNDLMSTNSRLEKELIVSKFRLKYPKINKDLDFCFEVLAGYHKLGYTYGAFGANPNAKISDNAQKYFENKTIKSFVTEILKTVGSSISEITYTYTVTPPNCRRFFEMLMNREFKLGYSNKQAMISSISPMLAKRYPEDHSEGYYYIQEKLDGNRCIAIYEKDHWAFYARSGKPLKVSFDMNWADKNYVYDGEVMTLGKAGTRDFNRTSGIINSKYIDKSELHYFIYDIIADNLKYEERYSILTELKERGTSSQCTILEVLDKVYVNLNPEYNAKLDKWLDYIVDKGGEGIILRKPDGLYEHKRSYNLLKYKKTKTMDLRIVDWNEGKGKYEGAIGSFVCATDDNSIIANVAGISDELRWANPDTMIGKIIEVAYFDQSLSKSKSISSLRFPRFKRFRPDKNETSIY